VTTGQAPKRKGSDQVLIAATMGDPGVRFHDFIASLLNLKTYMRDRALINMLPGVNVTHNCNEACKMMLEKGMEWLWLIGDDHVFAPNIVEELMKHDVDVIVPHCLKRVPSFEPVIYAESDEDDIHTPYLDIPATRMPRLPESGLTPVHAAGTAGMLIRRRVLEQMEQPYFRTYGHQNEDLMFCKRIREMGIQIYCDPEIKLGHIGLVAVYPIGLLAPNDGRWLGWGVELSLGAEDINMNVHLRRIAGNSLAPA